jgi:hypothetical protein
MSLADAVVDASPHANYMFVLSTTHPLNMLSSLADFDGFCTTAANTHGMPGSYVAWVSGPGRDAITQLGSSRGWIRPDGMPVVDTVANLTNSFFYYPPRLDETKADFVTYPPTSYVATATDATGVLVPGLDCGSGNVAVGLPDADDARWTNNMAPIACTNAAHAYCFGIGNAMPVAPTIDPNDRVAFITKATFSNSGLSGADYLCNQEANAAMLSGTYGALLSTTSASAASRFKPGAPWRRVDGVRITSDFTTWEAPLDVAADGMRVRAQYFVYSGAASPSGVASSATDTCADWTSNASGPARIGDAARSNLLRVFGFAMGACSIPRPIYCFQQ